MKLRQQNSLQLNSAPAVPTTVIPRSDSSIIVNSGNSFELNIIMERVVNSRQNPIFRWCTSLTRTISIDISDQCESVEWWNVNRRESIGTARFHLQFQQIGSKEIGLKAMHNGILPEPKNTRQREVIPSSRVDPSGQPRMWNNEKQNNNI